MLHHITGTLTRFHPLILIANEFHGVLAHYQGSKPSWSHSSFFLYPVLDERTKSINYYAFDTYDQWHLFTTYLKISGVGPKIALTLAWGMNDLVREACETKDPKKLQAIPGVGPKLATKILVELTHTIVLNKVTHQKNPLIKKIVTQLVSLGYDKHRVTHILDSYPNPLTDETLHACFVWCIHQLK